jgi:short-subunit dehydrogenase
MNIIITGASKGIGRAIAEKYAANNYSLWLCARNEDTLASLARSLKAGFPESQVNYFPCDLSRREDVNKFAAWIKGNNTSVDILVNNAGSFLPGNIGTEEEGTLETLMQLNVVSAYYLTRELLAGMKARQSGHIFNICSIASLKAYDNGGSYSITKYALAGFSTNLREELKSHNIKVTSVFPGAVYTDSWSESGVPPERIMKAEDIAEMIFAASRLSPQACVEEIVIRPQLGDL